MQSSRTPSARLPSEDLVPGPHFLPSVLSATGGHWVAGHVRWAQQAPYVEMNGGFSGIFDTLFKLHSGLGLTGMELKRVEL